LCFSTNGKVAATLTHRDTSAGGSAKSPERERAELPAGQGQHGASQRCSIWAGEEESGCSKLLLTVLMVFAICGA